MSWPLTLVSWPALPCAAELLAAREADDDLKGPRPGGVLPLVAGLSLREFAGVLAPKVAGIRALAAAFATTGAARFDARALVFVVFFAMNVMLPSAADAPPADAKRLRSVQREVN